jgi:RNA polymerase sigma-70 factor (ECF subfamily)
VKKLSYPELAGLVRQIQRGDGDAFTELYLATVEPQRYFAASFLKDAALADDVVQEVYLSLYNALSAGKLLNPELLVAYLNKITYNTCVDYKKKYGDVWLELCEETLEQQADGGGNEPEERYAVIERGSELQKAIAELPEQQRSIFLLRFYRELKIDEIAAATGLNESTVRRNIKAAKERLKRDKQLASLAPRYAVILLFCVSFYWRTGV